jgi:colanic acid/amylovoran biosynthesis glycosyltransferase
MTHAAASAPTTLLFFTGSYPYGAAFEDTFVAPELPYLCEVFDRVILVPTRKGGGRVDLGPDVEVEEGLAALTGSVWARGRGLLSALASALLWREFLERPIALVRFAALGRLLRTLVRAQLTRQWLKEYMRTRRSPPDHVVAYTFWCDGTTTGIALAKRELGGLTLVSRAHGADIYAERYRPPYFPARAITFAQLDGLFPDSETGRRYLTARFPSIGHRTELARMGVSDPGFTASASNGSNRTVVSCSQIVPIKRIDLIGRAVAEAARIRPDLTIQWHHFGEGEGRDQLERETRESLPSNASVQFRGFDGVDALMRFYETHPVDVFVNASSSEGTPVSIMEAASCGIPIVATAVGGNTEIVSEKNGETVPADASAKVLADAILRVAVDPDVNARLRQGSRDVWLEAYSASTNYSAFARRIAEPRTSRGARP